MRVHDEQAKGTQCGERGHERGDGAILGGVRERDDDLWVGILASSHPRVFCAGADLKCISKGERIETKKGGFMGLVKFPLTKPLIAAVDGKALAGGMELVLSCDLVVAAQQAMFGLPEVKRSLVAAAGGLFRLPRLVPQSVAVEMCLTGDPITATRAHELGLVNAITEQGKALEGAMQLAERIVVNAPLACREAKACIADMQFMDEEEAFARAKLP